MSESAASKFMSIVTDDLLLEIFHRLPHSRAVLQCGSVCNRWFSLIHSNLDEFIRAFSEHHNHKRASSDSSYYLPCTLLFRYLGQIDQHPHYHQPLFPEKSRSLHAINSNNNYILLVTNYLSFLPQPVIVWASFEDLLLVSTISSPKLFYICNPLTKEWVDLPESPPDQNHLRCGLVRDDQRRFRVVLHCASEDYATIFCSETGEWDRVSLLLPWIPLDAAMGVKYDDKFQTIFTTNEGTLHWLRAGEVVSFDPYSKRCRLIKSTPDKLGGRSWRSYGERVRLGVVRGRLRISQMYDTGVGFVLRVWELMSSTKDGIDDLWRLLHNVRVIWEPKPNRMIVVAFHPDNGDEIFLGRDFDICRYEIKKDKFEKIGEFPLVPGREIVPMFYFTLLHPLWPTSPTL